MADQVERLRIIIEADGIPRLADGTRLTAQEVVRLGQSLQQTSTELAETGRQAESAGRRVGALGREIVQGDWRGAAVQMGQLAMETGAFGGGLGVLRAGLGAATVALGAYAVAMYQAEQETHRQANAILLTGNYAGLVSGQLDALARSSAAANSANLGDTRQTMEALVATGRVTVQSLSEMTQAIELVSAISGQSREKVLGDFSSMANGVAKWAADHNKAYHFLTIEQYRYIEALELAGNAQEAMRVTSVALSQHLGGDLTRNLGTLQGAWKGVRDWASRAWDAMLNVGRPESAADRVEKLARDLEALQSRRNSGRYTDDVRNRLIADVQAQLDTARETVRLERQAADARSDEAQRQEAAIAAAREKTRPDRPVREDPEIEARRRLLAELNGLSGSFAKDWERLSALYKEGALSLEQLIEAQAELLAKQPAMRAEAAAQAAIVKAQATAERELADTRKRAIAMQEQQLAAQERDIASLMASNGQVELQAQQVGLTTQELARLTLARIDAAIAEEQLNLVGKQNIEGADAEVALIERKIRLLERQRDLTKDLTDKQAADELKKKNEADTKKFSEDLRRDVTDSLQRAFESGKNPAEALASTLSSMIKTRLTRALAEAIANPILKPLEQALGGAGGGGGDLFGGLLKFMQGSGGILPGDFVSMGLHSGGMVGAEATFMRSIGAPSFAHANRFHGGGLVGGEVPIIAKKGEGVFTEGQMKALAPVGAAAPQVTVNVHTLQGQTASVQQRQGRDGLNIDVIVQQIEDQLAGNIAAGSGAIGQAIEGRYNLRTAVV